MRSEESSARTPSKSKAIRSSLPTSGIMLPRSTVPAGCPLAKVSETSSWLADRNSDISSAGMNS